MNGMKHAESTRRWRSEKAEMMKMTPGRRHGSKAQYTKQEGGMSAAPAPPPFTDLTSISSTCHMHAGRTKKEKPIGKEKTRKERKR